MRTKRTTVVIVAVMLLCCGVLWAQVTSAPKLMVWTSSGVVFVPLPPGWSISFSPQGVPSLGVGQSHDDWQQLPAAQSVFALGCSPVGLAVHRNGLKARAGFDFDLANSTVTFRDVAAPQIGDTVEFEYGCS